MTLFIYVKKSSDRILVAERHGIRRYELLQISKWQLIKTLFTGKLKIQN